MIGYVKGILEEADDQCIIVDNHGIGYRIFVPGSVFFWRDSHWSGSKNIYISECKEDAMQLYGFCDKRRSESV